MNDGQPFIDYYHILQVQSDCSAKSLESAYRHLAKLYHPDSAETADVDKFNAVIEAYRILRDPEQRAEFDALYSANNEAGGVELPSGDEEGPGGKSALQDADAHARILQSLYRRRREHALDPGVGRYFVQEMLGCSDEHFEFHLWYLKAKGFIETTEQGTLMITIEGVDHVISTSRAAMREKLLITQSGNVPPV